MTDPKVLLTRQITTVNSIINFIKNTKQKKAVALQTVHYFEARLKLLEGYWTSFVERHKILIENRKDFEDHEYFTRDGSRNSRGYSRGNRLRGRRRGN